MDGMAQSQRGQVQRLHEAVCKIREIGGSGAPPAGEDVLMLVAAKPGLSLRDIIVESGLPSSTAHRALGYWGATGRYERTSRNLIERVSDPRHQYRQLYFLTEKGREAILDIMKILYGHDFARDSIQTGKEYLSQLQSNLPESMRVVKANAFSPSTITVGKRALMRKGISVEGYIVAFPLAPASKVIEDVRAWVDARNGKTYLLPTISKPDGMVIVDFPTKSDQLDFIFCWRQESGSDEVGSGAL